MARNLRALLTNKGKTTEEISSFIFIAEGTMRNYFPDATSKLHGLNRIDAARITKHKGWL